MSINIWLKGPRFVKKDEAFKIICSCSEVPENPTAEFHVNNGVSNHNQITKIEPKCEQQTNYSTCSDNKLYELVYHAPKSSSILSVSCALTFHPFGELSKCMFVQVVGRLTNCSIRVFSILFVLTEICANILKKRSNFQHTSKLARAKSSLRIN